ncbi:RNA 3'-terminal phosphate cyclase [Candidatus Woesearchaeota archaeon]|nr:RNA 3'-terminal phosphate cyclase [Candidatus Woesearchaeota archaeon]
MITLDGSYGEGGGALVRTALALSTLTGKPFTVNKIRSGRPTPGLKAQHLSTITLLKLLCDAKTNEISLGSTILNYNPGMIKRGKFTVDIGTAGSISLLLQGVLLPSMFSSGKVTFTLFGGTCGKWQASVDYLQNILLPHLQRFTKKLQVKVLKRGYFPRGGGEVVVEVSPKFSLKKYPDFGSLYEELSFMIPKITLIEKGDLAQIRGVVNVSRELSNNEVGERIKKSAEVHLRKNEVPISIRVEYSNSKSVGGEIVLWAVCSKNDDVHQFNPVIIGSDALIERNKTAEEVGKSAAQTLTASLKKNAPMDKYLADQLLIFMAMTPGSSIAVPEFTPHMETNMYVIEQFLPIVFRKEGNSLLVERKDL